MIATVIQNKNHEEILRLLDDPWIELAEIRLDLCKLSDEEIEDIFSNTDTPLIATCRSAPCPPASPHDRSLSGGLSCERSTGLSYERTDGLFEEECEGASSPLSLQNKPLSGGLSDEECERLLNIAIVSGAHYADLDISAPEGFSRRFRKLCREYGTEIIRSYHNYEGTPSLEELQSIRARCYRFGADIAKIVTTAKVPEDIAVVEALYGVAGEEGVDEGDSTSRASADRAVAGKKVRNRKLIAFAMGEKARSTRLSCLKSGAPFTYASLSDDLQTAEGQYSFEEMHRLVYGDFRGFWRVGDLEMPASKSFAQRAIIAAALADGRSHLYQYTSCEDSEAAIRVAKALGAHIHLDGSTLIIDGAGAAQTALSELNVGESGLLARICIPLMAVLNTRPVVIEGEKTLLRRPLKGVQDIMASFGVPIRSNKIPLSLTPPLIAGNAEISGKDGSQLISGLMMALPLCGKNSTLYVSEPKSIPYMFITEDILKKFGVRIKSEMEGDERFIEEMDWSACSQIAFTIKGGQSYKAADLEIEGDWSAAANFLVAGAIFGKAEVRGLCTKSLQADISIVDILVEAGAVLSELNGAVCVSKAPLEAFETDLGNAPDLFPVCSVLAAFCDGRSSLGGVNRLRAKESDRAAAIMEMLEGLGVEAAIEEDTLFIDGQTLTKRLVNGNLLKGGLFRTHHDHRMAMALKIASMGAESQIELDDPECVAKSFPSFWEMFDY
jgi:3-phosphoshikimate 1-carboxyvinyltransferase